MMGDLSNVKIYGMSSPYHHGQLRDALLQEAQTVLAGPGLAGLSLRDLARRIGVSPTAPYHHFKSKADLVAVLISDALGNLEGAMLAALEGIDDPAEQLQAIGVAYVLFAVDHPALYRLMFRPELCPDVPRPVSTEALFPDPRMAFRVLVRVVRAGLPASASPAQADRAVLAAWSLVHGLAGLLLDGPLRGLALDRARVHALAEALTAPCGPYASTQRAMPSE